MTPEDIEQLKQLKALKDDGVITEAEFETQKQLVLNPDFVESDLKSTSALEPESEKLHAPSEEPRPNVFVGSGGGGSPTSVEKLEGDNRPLKVFTAIFAIAALVAIGVVVFGGSDDSQSTNPIDEKMNVSVRCVVTDLERNSIVDIQEISESESLWTIAGQSYFYFNRFLTVTNYKDETHRVYVEHRYVDDNGKVWGSWNFLEYVNGGETQTFEENRIVQAPTEIVLRGNSATGEMAFDCPVTRAKL
jgi:hypothetical protein